MPVHGHARPRTYPSTDIPVHVRGELALAQVLAGVLLRPGFPEVLRHTAARRWRAEARLTLDYADAAYARRGDVVACAGSLAQAVVQAGHARLAATGAWALNEKRLVERAGLATLAERFARLGGTPRSLQAAVAEVRTLLVE